MKAAEPDIKSVQLADKVALSRSTLHELQDILDLQRRRWLGSCDMLKGTPSWKTAVTHAAECWYWSELAKHLAYPAAFPRPGRGEDVEDLDSARGMEKLLAAVRLDRPSEQLVSELRSLY